MQEIITLLVFAVFSVLYLGEAIRWNHVVAFGYLVMVGYFAFSKWGLNASKPANLVTLKNAR